MGPFGGGGGFRQRMQNSPWASAMGGGNSDWMRNWQRPQQQFPSPDGSAGGPSGWGDAMRNWQRPASDSIGEGAQPDWSQLQGKLQNVQNSGWGKMIPWDRLLPQGFNIGNMGAQAQAGQALGGSEQIPQQYSQLAQTLAQKWPPRGQGGTPNPAVG